jgi:hypothetical protein
MGIQARNNAVQNWTWEASVELIEHHLASTAAGQPIHPNLPT